MSASGTATYTVPLEPAPGRRGMQPGLSLRYDSGGTSGLLGRGWSLGGLSQVHRCATDPVHDGANRALSFDDTDPLCLDGARLIAVDGAYGQPATCYRTERDQLVNVCQVGSLNDDTSSFVAYASDGRTRYYGGTEESNVMGRDRIRAWAVREVVDRWGNGMTFEYEQDLVYSRPTIGSDNLLTSLNHRPVAIRYTHRDGEPGQRRVELEYRERGRGDQIEGYWFGTEFLYTVQLANVRMYGPDDDLVRRYEIQYTNSPDTTLSLVGAIAVCDGAGVCKPPTAFEYTDNPSPGALEIAWDGYPWNKASDHEDAAIRAIPLDADGDGYGDMLVRGSSSYRLFLSNRAADGDDFAPIETDIDISPTHKLSAADFNGDGCDDVFRVTSTGWSARLSPCVFESGQVAEFEHFFGLGTPEFAYMVDAAAGDFDGNGLADAISCRIQLRDECYAPDGGGGEGCVYDPPWQRCDDEDGGGGSGAQDCSNYYGTWQVSYNHGPETNVGEDDTGVICAAGCGPGGCAFVSSWIMVDFDHDGGTNLLQIEPYLPVEYDRAPEVPAGTSYYAIVPNAEYIYEFDFVDTHLPADLFQRYNFGLGSRGADRIVDVNGDGKADVLRFEPKSHSEATKSGDTTLQWDDHFTHACNGATWPEKGAVARVYYNTGIGFRMGDEFVEFEHWADLCDKWRPSLTVDYNADGRVDLVFPGEHEGKPELFVAQSALPESTQAIPTGDVLDDPDLPIYAVDVWGRGQYGIAYWQGEPDEHDGVWALSARTEMPNLLVKVTDGLGAEITIEHEAMTRESVYSGNHCELDPWPGPYPRCAYSPRALVSRVEYETSVNVIPMAYTYQYRDARYDPDRRRPLGFRKRIVTGYRQWTPITRTEYEYDVDTYDEERELYPYANQPVRTVTYESIASAGRHRVTVEASYPALFETDPAGSYRIVTPLHEVATYELDGVCNPETLDGCADLNSLSGEDNLIQQRSVVVAERDELGNPTRRTLDEGGGFFVEEHREHEREDGLFFITHPTEVTITGTSPSGTLERHYRMQYEPETWALAKEFRRPGQGDELIIEHIRNGDGNVTEVRLEAGDGVDSGVLSRGGRTVWDSEGVFPRTQIDVNARETTYTWDRGLGATTSIEDPNGVTDHVRYDGFGRRTEAWRTAGEKQIADGAIETIEYYRTAPGPVNLPSPLGIRHDVAGGQNIVIEHDQFDREVYRESRILGGGKVYTTASYAPEGWMSSRAAATHDGAIPTDVWYYDHDELGRVTEITPPGLGATSFEYVNRRVTVTDPRDNEWQREHDLQGRPRRVLDPLGTSICFFYNGLKGIAYTHVNTGAACGVGAAPVTAKATVDSYVIESDIDAYGWKRRVSDPNLGTREFLYNGFGELVRETGHTDGDTTFVYDDLGRIIERENGDGTAMFEYDEAGGAGAYGALRASYAPGGVERHYEYDAFGRPTVDTLVLDEESLSFRYTYDGYNRIKTIEYPEGPAGSAFEVRYYYGTFGHTLRVVDIETGAMFWRAHETDAAGRLIREEFGNGVISERGYDAGLLRWIHTGLPGGGPEVQDLFYAYDDTGNLIQRKDHIHSQYEDIEYDELDRINGYAQTARSGAMVVDAGGWNAEYGPLGNLTWRSDIGNYTYADSEMPMAVTLAGGTIFTYQDHRQVTRGGTTVSYTARDNVREIREPKITTTFEYDADHDRVRSEVTGDGAHVLIHHGDLYRLRIEPGWVLSREHEYYVPTDGKIVARVRKSAGFGGVVVTTLFHHDDHLGSTDVITDVAGSVEQRHSYTPWGEPRAISWLAGGVFQNLVNWAGGFTGHDDDRHAGLTFMRGRFYDARIGRFITPDPGVPAPSTTQAFDRFAYVYNRPLSLIDPSGFHPKDGISDEQHAAEQEAIANGEEFVREVVVHTNPAPRYYESNYGLLNGDPYFRPTEEIQLETAALSGVDAAVDVARSVGDLFAEETVDTLETGGMIVGGFVFAPAVMAYGGYKSYNMYESLLTGDVGDTLLGMTPMADAMSAYDAAQGGDYSGAAYYGLRSAKQLAEWVLGGRLAGKLPKCFAAGTKILTADGMVAIEDIEVGDEVWAVDPETGKSGLRTVTRTFVRHDARVLDLEIDDTTVRVTAEHPFWTRERGWVSAVELVPGDELYTSRGGWVRVGSGTWVEESTTVYNIEVDDLHTYFVGDAAVLAHNACPRKPVKGVENAVRHKNGDISYSIRGYVVRYDKAGFPDFSPFMYRAPKGTKSEVNIELTGRRPSDFAAANKKAGFEKTPAGYTWHHHQRVWDAGSGTWKGKMQLVQTDVHKLFPHSGGVSVYQSLTGLGYD